MCLWDLESGKELGRFPGQKELRRFPGCCAAAFSPDGRRALSGENGPIGLWDVKTGARVRQLPGHGEWKAVTSVVFLPGRRQALSCGHDCTLKLWDLDTGQEIRRFSGHTDGVNRVAITGDGRYAVSVGDKTVRLWDVHTGKELHSFTGHTEAVIGVAVSPDGKFALSGSLDGTMRLWRLPDLPPAEKVGEIGRFGAEGHWPRRVALSPDGKRLLTAGNEHGSGTARYWDIATGKEIYRMLPSKGHRFYDVAISSDGTKLLGCSGDGLIHVWDAATGKELKKLKGHTHEVIGVAVSPDGRMVASAGYDCHLRLWDLEKGELTSSPGNFAGGQGQGVRFSPDGTLMATWATDAKVRLWDVKKQKEIRCLEGHKDWVVAGAFSRDSSRLITGTWPSRGGGDAVPGPSEIILWEVATGKPLRTIDVTPRNVCGIAISPDGRRALSCGNAGLVELWDLETGKQIIAFKGHVGRVSDVAFLPDGRTAVSGGFDGTIRLWRLPDPPPAKKKP
jgi:WD40 repeat protein